MHYSERKKHIRKEKEPQHKDKRWDYYEDEYYDYGDDYDYGDEYEDEYYS
jgi:hypothetical protein